MSEHLRTVVEIVNFFFLFFVVFYTVFLFLSVIYGAIESEKRSRQSMFHKGVSVDHAVNYVPISILVPAYNEELTILDTVRSLCALDYPEFEVIVIDDGSRDNTAKVLIEALHLKKTERPIRRQVYCQDAIEIFESEHSEISLHLCERKMAGRVML